MPRDTVAHRLRRMQVVVLAAWIAFRLVSAGSAFGQSTADYLRLVDRYVEDADAAVKTLARQARTAVDGAVNACATMCSQQALVAAAMLHSDAAAVLMDSAPAEAAFHIRMASRLLGRVQERPVWVQRWYEYNAMRYVSAGRFQNATTLVNEGLARYPRAATLYAARGTVSELQVTADHPNLRGAAISDDRESFRVTRALEGAAADYRRALALDPRFEVARLRLGWIHLLLGDKRAADELSAIVQDATDDSIRYLAHLFLGGIAEGEGRLGDARQAYGAARQAGPRYQSACVALSHVEGALGDSTRAQEVALECFEHPKEDDPWWRLGAFDPQTLDWLYSEARRR